TTRATSPRSFRWKMYGFFTEKVPDFRFTITTIGTRTRGRSKRDLRGIANENAHLAPASARTPSGIRAASERIPARSRARDPDPDPDPTHLRQKADRKTAG